jgi:uncharacterized protein (TIGR02145 family)
MKTRILLTLYTLIWMINAFCQTTTLDLTFTAIDSSTYVQLDSIKVINLTQDVDTVIYYPDTTLTYEIIQGDQLLYIGYTTGFSVGIHQINKYQNNFQLFQNYPNPIKTNTTITLFIPKKGIVDLMVIDLQGRQLISSNWNLEQGYHSFGFIPDDDKLYIVTANWKGVNQSIKIISTGSNANSKCTLDYIGNDKNRNLQKATSINNKDIVKESGILDIPESNITFIFQYATNIPCIDQPIVTYEGKDYYTIQIFNQCWFKENLNVGIMIDGTEDQTHNGIIEKYCLINAESNCNQFGGLYQWDEMMYYTQLEGTKGICPPGWHIPSDMEWQMLEGATDSQYGIEDSIWTSNLLYRGYDQALNLKSKEGWFESGNGLDSYGFSAIASGHRFTNGNFSAPGTYGTYWSSSKMNWPSNDPDRRRFASFSNGINRQGDSKDYGFSVRCLKD